MYGDMRGFGRGTPVTVLDQDFCEASLLAQIRFSVQLTAASLVWMQGLLYIRRPHLRFSREFSVVRW